MVNICDFKFKTLNTSFGVGMDDGVIDLDRRFYVQQPLAVSIPNGGVICGQAVTDSYNSESKVLRADSEQIRINETRLAPVFEYYSI
jgi:hypothetical protein